MNRSPRAATEETLQRIIERSQADPEWFCREILGDEPWDKQIEILESILSQKRTAVKSCNGAGKTWIASRAALWGLVTHYNAHVITTAPTNRQVEGLLWSEISGAWRHAQERWPGLLPGRLFKIPRLEITKTWYAMGFSTNDPNAMQGIHAPFLLIILDEAGGNRGGVAANMWEPIDGNLVGEHCHLLTIGNPTDPSTPFFTECSDPTRTNVLTISAFDTPNFTTFGITEADIIAGPETWQPKITGPLPQPELITPQAVADALRKYGRESTYWQARILGRFPQQGTDTLLWMTWIEQAKAAREIDLADSPFLNIRIGCDIARTGDNETVISAFGKQNDTGRWRQLLLEPKHQDDTTRTRDLIIEIALQLHVTHPDARISVRIDADGLGGPVYDMVREVHYRHPEWTWLEIIAVHSGITSDDPELYANTRAQYWWAVREIFEESRIELINDDLQTSQLSSIKWRETSAQRKIQIESKEEAEKRGVASPDRGDALMLALAPVSVVAGMVLASPAVVKPAATTFNARLNKRYKRPF